MATTSNSYTGNGSTTNYSITFEYLKQDDVKASLDGTATTAFTFANATTLSFNSAPASGAAIRIFRDTDIDSLKATFFPGSAIKAEDLNDNFTQNNFATQETDNDVIDANTTAASAVTTANSAVTTANSAVTTANSAVTTANSAVTTANSAVTTANTADTNATAAVNTANTASTNATNAVNTANTATTTANSAVTTANSAVTDAATAISTANSATTTANNAVTAAAAAQTDANTATTTANNATTTANAATTTANSATTTANNAATTVSTYVHDGTNPAGDGVGSNPQGLAYAINQATGAVATANAASAAVANAAFYSPIAALANLPASPSNEDRVEVTNSTGVESSSAVSGVPSGFVGATTLSVRLQYNSSTSKWVYQQYFANDPDERYATNYLPVIKGDGTTNGQTGKITLNCSNNSHGVSIQSPPHSAAATYTLTLPIVVGTANNLLTTDGSGNLSWRSAHYLASTSGGSRIDVTANQISFQTNNTQQVLLDTNGNLDLQYGALRFWNGQTNSYVTIKRSTSSTSYDLTLPTGPGSAGEALVTDGNGVLSFASVDSAFIETPQTISANKTIAANTNAGMMGPTVSLNSGVTITVGSNSILTVLS